MSDKAKAMERLIQSVVTGEKLRTATNAELADLMREHVWAGLMMCSAVADLVGEAMDRLRGLKTCASCHGWGYVEHVRCAICDGTGDVEPRARETEDGAVREAAKEIPANVPLATAISDARDALHEDRHVSIAASHGRMLVAMGNLLDAITIALSSPPRPETKADDKGGAA